MRKKAGSSFSSESRREDRPFFPKGDEEEIQVGSLYIGWGQMEKMVKLGERVQIEGGE